MEEGLTERSFQPTLERVKERLRQERQTFDQHKAHENLWFRLRLVMGYSSVVLLIGIMFVSSYILVKNAFYPGTVVTAAGAALFADTLGLVVSIWKVVFNPTFMTKLSAITQAEQSFFEDPVNRPSSVSDQLIILSAKYGVNDIWMDVAPLLRAKVENGKLLVIVNNEEFGGGDPARGLLKKLDITYSHRGSTYSKTLSEKTLLSIP